MKLSTRRLAALAITLGFLVAVPTFAANITTQIEKQTSIIREKSELSTASLPVIIGSIINAVVSLLGVVMIVYFVYAGFLWSTAGGDSKQIDTAKTIMKNATIGLAVLLASYSIAEFVLNAILASTGTGAGGAPTSGS